MSSPERGNAFTSGFYLQAVRLARRVRLSSFRGFGSVWTGDESSDVENESGDSSDDDDPDEDLDPERECDTSVEGKHKNAESGMKKASSSLIASPEAALDHPIAHLTKIWSSPGQAYGHLVKNGRVHTLAMLRGRETNLSKVGRWSRAECCHMGARYLPVDYPKIIDRMSYRVYVGNFSSDGSLFVGGFQERHIRVYNTEQGWSLKKDILARQLRWTVTDTALSQDQRFLIYATISPIVHLVNIANESDVESLANVTDIHEGLDFSMDSSGEISLGLYSVQFSKDGREIVAGSNQSSIYVYDLEANRTNLCLQAHNDDVNSVTYADETCHLIISGSDDHICKVWDRRCLMSRSRPAGQLEGHLEGITFIDTRGDGRYFISNGKDQTIKLWDIRTMSSTTRSSKVKGRRIPSYNWDYRWMDYPGVGLDVKHPNDQSLMTYKGHQVLRTLIRCYFSPVFTTGQKYIYTGSHDGCVYIYDLVTGQIVGKLAGFHRSTVRDCSWHPLYPILVSSSWDGKILGWEHLHGDSPISRRYEHYSTTSEMDEYMSD